MAIRTSTLKLPTHTTQDDALTGPGRNDDDVPGVARIIAEPDERVDGLTIRQWA